MARILKISEQSQGANYASVPTILLKGKWLEAEGFKIGEYVEVTVVGDEIKLKKTNPPEKASKIALEEKIKSMTPKERQKLNKMIDELKK